MIDPTQLEKKLLEAGVPIIGCSSTGRIDFKDTATPQQIATAQTILATFDINDPVDHRKMNIEARVIGSNAAIRNIPSWALYSETEGLAWIQTNIGTPLTNGRTNLPATLTLATTRAAFIAILDILDKMLILMIALTRIAVALRDKNWPDIPEN